MKTVVPKPVISWHCPECNTQFVREHALLFDTGECPVCSTQWQFQEPTDEPAQAD